MHFRPLLVNLAACFNCYDRGIGLTLKHVNLGVVLFLFIFYLFYLFFNNFLRNSSAQHTEDTSVKRCSFFYFSDRKKKNCYKKKQNVKKKLK